MKKHRSLGRVFDMFVLYFKNRGEDKIITKHFDTEEQMYNFIKRQDIEVIKVESI